MISNPTYTTLLVALALGAGGSARAADDTTPRAPPPAPPSNSASRPEPAKAVRLASSTKVCRADEDTLRVLRLTTVDGGVRVDYEFVVSGRATWTQMNRPLLKQFGVRAAGTFCLPKDTRAGEETDYD